MSGALRYTSVAAMPDSIRNKVESQGKGAAREVATKPSKYGNQPTTVDGIRFDSKKEARYYEQLKIRQNVGEVAYFHRQVPITLPGNTKYVVDFQVFHTDGTVEYVDVKGKQTESFRFKKRQVESLYPIRIVLA